MTIPSRIRDYIHERRIARLYRAMKASIDPRDGSVSWSAWNAYADAHAQRSPEAVARMERARGLRPRTTIKRALIAGYCRKIIPARAVTALFALFRLRGL